MSSWPDWINKKNLGIAAACAGGVALLIYPASIITLGLGAALGYKGKDWLRRYLDQQEEL